MSLLSNANITRYGIISSWNSHWVESNMLYSSIIYTDIYINEFINGIYYKLKMPTTLPITKSIGYNKTLIFVDSLIFNKEGRFFKWPNYYRNAFDMKYQMRHIMFHINRISKNIRLNNNKNIYNASHFKCIYKITMSKLKYIINKKKIKNSNLNSNINIRYYKKLNNYFFKKNKLEKYIKRLSKRYKNRFKQIKNINYTKFFNKKKKILYNIYTHRYKKIINNIRYVKINTKKNNKHKYINNRYKLYQLFKFKNKINNINNNKLISKNVIRYIANRINKIKKKKKLILIILIF